MYIHVHVHVRTVCQRKAVWWYKILAPGQGASNQWYSSIFTQSSIPTSKVCLHRYFKLLLATPCASSCNEHLMDMILMYIFGRTESHLEPWTHQTKQGLDGQWQAQAMFTQIFSLFLCSFSCFAFHIFRPTKKYLWSVKAKRTTMLFQKLLEFCWFSCSYDNWIPPASHKLLYS